MKSQQKRLTWILALAQFCLLMNAQHLEIVVGEGQADIRGGRVKEAQDLALSWAKWDAVAKKLGVAIKASTLTENSAVVEDIIQSEVQGVVRVSKIVQERQIGQIYHVKIEAIVDEDNAQKKVEELIRNTSLVVMLPASFGGETRFQNAVSELLIQRLTQRRYTVIDETAVSGSLSASQLENLMRSSSVALRSAAIRFLSNVAVLGKIEGTVTIRPGDRIPLVGYVDYYGVRATATYRVLSLAGGGMTTGQIVGAGTVDAVGIGSRAEAAFDNAVRALAASAATEIIPKYEQYFNSARRAIEIRFQGNIDLGTHSQLKNLIAQIRWASNLSDLGLGHFRVDYAEKPVYLAYSLEQKPGVKVVSFSDRMIEAAVE